MATKSKNKATGGGRHKTKILADFSEQLNQPVAILLDSSNVMLAFSKRPDGTWLPTKFYGLNSWDSMLNCLHGHLVKSRISGKHKKKDVLSSVEQLRKVFIECKKEIAEIGSLMHEKSFN